MQVSPTASIITFCSYWDWLLTPYLPAGAAKHAVCTGDESLAHVHLCHICQGSGVHTEVYEFRRLEVSRTPLQ